MQRQKGEGKVEGALEGTPAIQGLSPGWAVWMSPVRFQAVGSLRTLRAYALHSGATCFRSSRVMK